MEGKRLEGEDPLKLPRMDGQVEGCIFDLDGTLATIPVDWEAVRQRLSEISGASEQFRPVFPTIGRVIGERPELRDRLLHTVDQYELTAAPRAQFFAGVKQLLSILKAKGVKLSLVTMQGRRTAGIILDREDLSGFFQSRLGREDSLDRAEQLGIAVRSLGTDKSRTVFIGDRYLDLLAAREVGLPFVMIRTHGDDPSGEHAARVTVYHSIEEFLTSLENEEQ